MDTPTMFFGSSQKRNHWRGTDVAMANLENIKKELKKKEIKRKLKAAVARRKAKEKG